MRKCVIDNIVGEYTRLSLLLNVILIKYGNTGIVIFNSLPLNVFCPNIAIRNHTFQYVYVNRELYMA